MPEEVVTLGKNQEAAANNYHQLRYLMESTQLN